MCELFSVSVNFKKIVIENVIDTINENKEVILSLEIDGKKFIEECNEPFILSDVCYKIENSFILRATDLINQDDFIFNVLGNLLKVKLLEMNLENENETILSEGHIKLLNFLQKCDESTMIMKILDTSITLHYDILFDNLSEIASTFSIEIPFIYNFPLNQDDKIEACIRFPFDQIFRAVMLQKNDMSQNDISPHLIDDLLKRNNDDDSSCCCINLAYENFQLRSGVKLFHELIKNEQKFLVEMKMQEKMFMALIDLDIFNYPGVNDVVFIAPLCEWNSKIIKELFQQEANLRFSQSSVDSNISKTSADDLMLKEIIFDEKHVAVKVRMKISKPLKEKIPTDVLLSDLNKIFPFMVEKKAEEIFINACSKDLECTVRKIASKMERHVKENPHLNDDELKSLINQNLCLKNELKETVETIIGNKFNVEKKTETNREFKLLMIDVFKSLSKEIDEIMIRRNKIKPKSFMNDNVRKWQIEEYIENKNFKMAREIINQELNDNLDEMKLKERAIFYMKMRDYKNAEDALVKLLRIDKCCSFSFYLLSYIFVEREEISAAILTFRTLTRIKSSVEFWILLSMLYEQISLTCGVEFCELKIQENPSYLANYSSNISTKYPEFTSNDPLANMLHNQLTMTMPKFAKMTREYMERNDAELKHETDEKWLLIMEFIEQEQYEEGCEILKTIKITNENEIAMRIMKGNLLYSNNTWRSVCEYEIAYNLSLNSNIDFPYLPTIRCGLWYLNELKNVTKARRYFHYCCTHFATFDSWMGIGEVELISMNYEPAERYFNQANQIDQKSSQNWISLALVNAKLQRSDVALKCYLAAKNHATPMCNEKLTEVEIYLNI